MASRSYLKDIRALIRLAEEQGWQVEHTDSGHLRWTPPIGESLTTSSTPGGGRAMENIRSDLRSIGLIMSRADYRRQMKALTREAAGIAPERLSLIDRYREQIEAAAAASNISIAGVADFSDITVIKLVELINPETGRFNLTHECGRVYVHPLGYLQHTLKCDTDDPTPEPQEDTDVDRNMKAPPEREKIYCAECPEWFWISQPGLLNTHMVQEHHKDQCPHCLRWFSTRSGGLGKHVQSCRKNPDRLAPNDVVVLPEMPLTGDNQVTVQPIVVCDGKATPHRQDALCRTPVAVQMNPPAAGLLAEIEKTQQLALENEDLSNQLLKAAEQRAQEIIAEAEARVAAAIEAASKGENGASREEPASPGASESTIRRASNASDDDLWALLEMVLAGPIALNRESFGAINEWMIATRKLFAIMEGS